MTGTQNLSQQLQTKATVLLVSGTIGFIAAKYVFDASTLKAVIIGTIVAAIGIGLISFSIPTPQPVLTP